MYKALIADDEEIIRRGIAKLLSKDPTITEIIQAEDGEMALELAREHLPDFLFVDVNMPVMSGLDFIEQLGEALENCSVILISGYDDFDYVQKALRLGVFDYLLKPINEKTFFSAVDKAKNKLDQSSSQRKYLRWAKEMLEENKAGLIAEFLDKWLCGQFSETEADDRLRYLGIELPEQFGISLVHMNSVGVDCGREWDDDLLYYAAANIASEMFGHLAPVCTCKNSSGDLVILSSCQPEDQWREAGAQLTSLLQVHLPTEAVIVQEMGTGSLHMPAVYDQTLSTMQELSGCSQIVQETKKYIEENCISKGFSLLSAAEHTHVSPQHLSRLFRHETGVTFVDYTTRMRIRRAIDMLANPNLKMYEISQATGYSSQHYFSSAFKKVLGVSPLEYRKKL